MTTIADILSAIDRLAPWRLAQDWDNCGLMLGDPARPAHRMLISLDVSERICDEAERRGADVLLAHHPLFFRPPARLTTETRPGRLALRLAGQGRAVIAAHTNLDAADGGICDILAEALGVGGLLPLRASAAETRTKVVVFVPAADLEAVRSAAFAAGAGQIGHYAECSFAAAGEGTFLPGAAAHPAIGQIGRRNEAAERRLEVLVPQARLAAVVAAIGRAHPYEEPAIDIYPLHGLPGAAGVGRVGTFAKPMRLAALADETKRVLGLGAIPYAGDPDLAVERVVVVAGGGGGLATEIAAAGAQAVVTGEMKYHEIEDLAAQGIGVILGGHHRTERVPLMVWAERHAAAFGVEVLRSECEEDSVQVR